MNYTKMFCNSSCHGNRLQSGCRSFLAVASTETTAAKPERNASKANMSPAVRNSECLHLNAFEVCIKLVFLASVRGNNALYAVHVALQSNAVSPCRVLHASDWRNGLAKGYCIGWSVGRSHVASVSAGRAKPSYANAYFRPPPR